ncbi:hypothetical protein NE237_023225 [Protea cynaroides]|uniref:Non-haem dioxygenase N-terminal domain-containing protein n=1 Tax=Protea cynaroides TaxID=273540 RepID=A0A9Q0K4Y1_9MAGN|nr:hypothetical protein NE237_023225 [Protea cynaroides]
MPQEEKEKYANDHSAGKFDGYGTKMTKNHDEWSGLIISSIMCGLFPSFRNHGGGKGTKLGTRKDQGAASAVHSSSQREAGEQQALEGVKVPIIFLSQPNDVLVKEEVGEEFVKLPQEEKDKYANDHSAGKFDGYGTKMTKNHDEKVEWVDYFFHHVWPPSKGSERGVLKGSSESN